MPNLHAADELWAACRNVATTAAPGGNAVALNMDVRSPVMRVAVGSFAASSTVPASASASSFSSSAGTGSSGGGSSPGPEFVEGEVGEGASMEFLMCVKVAAWWKINTRGASRARYGYACCVSFFPTPADPNVQHRTPNVTHRPQMYTTPMGAFHVSRSIPIPPTRFGSLRGPHERARPRREPERARPRREPERQEERGR